MWQHTHRAYYPRKLPAFFLWHETESNLKNGTLKVILTTQRTIVSRVKSLFFRLFIRWGWSRVAFSQTQLVRTIERRVSSTIEWIDGQLMSQCERVRHREGENMCEFIDGIRVCLHLQRQLVEHFTYVSFESSLKRIMLIDCVSTNKLYWRRWRRWQKTTEWMTLRKAQRCINQANG